MPPAPQTVTVTGRAVALSRRGRSGRHRFLSSSFADIDKRSLSELLMEVKQ